MNSFDAFLAELHVAYPDLDLAPLETVLRNLAFEADDLALTLFGPVKWTVRQTEYPPLVRLAYIHDLLADATKDEAPLVLHWAFHRFGELRHSSTCKCYVYMTFSPH